ncbi:hypothetical protein [Clostridium luticellarii]|uniref:hypothetical protein n=1 Tax=Clostridium luticellarii TaxID=1691940 RepID=UPI0011B208B8|nr:hypothetical protein [Clostridium luticellarii]
MIDYMKNEMNTDVETAGSGIYYVKGTDIDTQILVSKQLDDREAGYLKLLQVHQKDKNLTKNWIEEYIDNIKNPLYAVIMNVLAKADPDEILEVYKNMGVPKISESNMEFLMDMMKKFELDKKLEQKGKEEGIEEGIKQLILKQYGKGLSVEYIADINDIDVENVRKIIERSDLSSDS